MSKHLKTLWPSDADLIRNPMIGAGKGTTMVHVIPDDIEDSEGANTIEGDVLNDVNSAGGIDKADARTERGKPNG